MSAVSRWSTTSGDRCQRCPYRAAFASASCTCGEWRCGTCAAQQTAGNTGGRYQNNGYQYGGPPRNNFWRSNQERLDKKYNKYLLNMERESKLKEEEERARKNKEEEEKKEEWRKEREKLESEMAARIDMRMDEVCKSVKVKCPAEGECSAKCEDEVARLKRENEEPKQALRGDTDDGKESKRYEIVALKHEIQQLRESAVKEQELAGLKRQLEDLRIEARQWKDEALRPGNKRGSIALSTPDANARASPMPRRTCEKEQEQDWRSEYRKLQSLRRADFVEVEALKKKKAQAEMEVINLQKQMNERNANEVGKEMTPGGTNLKERLEAVALGTAQKGRKATPNREGLRPTPRREEKPNSKQGCNDRTTFVEEQTKFLKMLRKSALEQICKEAGLKAEKVDEMIEDIVQFRVKNAFGKKDDKEPVEVVDVESSRDESTSGGDEVSAEL
ncbi:hypothetical protein CBR_g18807 [Chara braunii]|uniref:Uncharacterized protein n=1 Tax=Chara braunii TaxID=69332 RepID=A0A388KWF5_CHABU|nr:hypothetical protein CBR_g18807 [Chara braunii]|eukprot:GBG74396.1 hypothetical protein CBR_g18807 [Chara braunii]